MTPDWLSAVHNILELSAPGKLGIMIQSKEKKEEKERRGGRRGAAVRRGGGWRSSARRRRRRFGAGDIHLSTGVPHFPASARVPCAARAASACAAHTQEQHRRSRARSVCRRCLRRGFGLLRGMIRDAPRVVVVVRLRAPVRSTVAAAWPLVPRGSVQALVALQAQAARRVAPVPRRRWPRPRPPGGARR